MVEVEQVLQGTGVGVAISQVIHAKKAALDQRD